MLTERITAVRIRLSDAERREIVDSVLNEVGARPIPDSVDNWREQIRWCVTLVLCKVERLIVEIPQE